MTQKIKVFFQYITVIALMALTFSGFQYFQTGKLNWYQKQSTSALDVISDQDESPPESADTSISGVEILGRVTSVTDGDTLRIENLTGGSDIIRLYGIDAPEKDQPYGSVASNALRTKVNDARVRVVVKDTDDFGRQVGTVYLESRNINLEMVAEGHAWWYEFFAPDNRELRQAHIKAEESQLGLWRNANPVEPYDWRRSH